VAERAQPSVVGERTEAPEATARHVLEEDTLDGILGAEGEDLFERRLERLAHGPHRFTG
jgi:hypothetical protein